MDRRRRKGLLEELINYVYANGIVERNDPNWSKEEAEKVCRANLGYYAGYYGNKEMEKTYRLFSTSHPIFGSATPIPEKSFGAGKKFGEDMKKKEPNYQDQDAPYWGKKEN